MAQRAVVDAELADFDSWVGISRIKLKRIEIVDLPETIAGSYRFSGRVELNDAFEGDLLRKNLRHELCHALAHQGDIGSQPSAFGRLLDTLVERDIRPDFVADGDERVEEGFALFCEEGPWATLGHLDGCDPDFPAAELAKYAAGVAWEPSLFGQRWRLSEWHRAPIMALDGTPHFGLLFVFLYGDAVWIVVDTGGGGPVLPGLDMSTLKMPEHDDDQVQVDVKGIGPWLYQQKDAVQTTSSVVATGGTGLGLLVDYGGVSFLQASSGGGAWGPVGPGCRERREQLFVWKDQAYTAHLEGIDLVISAVEP